jgi:hypothetical protein
MRRHTENPANTLKTEYSTPIFCGNLKKKSRFPQYIAQKMPILCGNLKKKSRFPQNIGFYL